MLKSANFRIGETILGLATLSLGLFIAIETWMTPPIAAQAVIGPGLFPALIAGGLILVGAQLLYEAVIHRLEAEEYPELDWRAVIIVAAAFASQLVILERLGWIISGAFLFAVSAMAFGSRTYVWNIVIGVMLSSITYVVFDYGLDLDLPTGSLVEDVIIVFGGTL
ncbi:tripartite tricarboxylate transporter TctB family protein [Sinorhizobium sp. BG8]|uniref:tripartite tricarboxylate transporter TctB family protein n=1 Tax=Sinorhizobium sp. BG8 TaxID=2613773 RepID=UPI00193E944D|nr:tripartite tricarboxylate transporter TctB family protein [Sinorhizobium sp. BG8]QRM56185.1 tripartite tricarboxylate transporter TctB family protein [Sinorhizobium sp. BG8]